MIRKYLVQAARIIARGKSIMFVYTVSMIALSWYATMKSKSIDGSVATMYGIALGAYATSKGHELYEQNKTKTSGNNGESGENA